MGDPGPPRAHPASLLELSPPRQIQRTVGDLGSARGELCLAEGGGGSLDIPQHSGSFAGQRGFPSAGAFLRCSWQMEDAVLDVYDLVYDQAVKSSPSIRRQELVAIQDTDCLQSIRSFLRTHGNITSTLTGLGLASTVYAMLLTSFLWFAIRSGCSLDRRGKYTLSPRAHGCQPQEPSVFRPCQAGPTPHGPAESDVLHSCLGPSGRWGGPQLLQDSRHSVSATCPPSEAKLARTLPRMAVGRIQLLWLGLRAPSWAGCQLPETTCIPSHVCLDPPVDRGHVASSRCCSFL
ncbi:hypothetical protein MC885_020612 [Smutsia gigantea]|nr:hypothetical protein MC885_020612 [Smutsia gigantea]